MLSLCNVKRETVNSLSIVIPSYNRGEVLLGTIASLTKQSSLADEIIIVDQTDYSSVDENVLIRLQEMDDQCVIRYIQRTEPSIPKAMNVGLLSATSQFVLFLDDDIEIAIDFLEQHKRLLLEHDAYAHVGQVLQPGEYEKKIPRNYDSGKGLYKDLSFVFSSSESRDIHNCMAGNLCVDRLTAIKAGGFDENFIGSAYRFETEFCRRMIRFSGRPFYYSPKPVIHHLQCPTGGTRNTDHFLSSSSPRHSVGDYYFAMRESEPSSILPYCLRRLFGCLKARFYLRKPWYLPVRFIGEVRGFLLARRLCEQGPRFCVDTPVKLK